MLATPSSPREAVALLLEALVRQQLSGKSGYRTFGLRTAAHDCLHRWVDSDAVRQLFGRSEFPPSLTGHPLDSPDHQEDYSEAHGSYDQNIPIEFGGTSPFQQSLP
jgi:hypothetical protein